VIGAAAGFGDRNLRRVAVEHVVVVGASLGGLRTVQSLRSSGFTGKVTLVGEEHHRPYDRPPLSKHVLSGEWEAEQAFLADQAELDRIDVDLKLGQRAVDLDVASRTVGLHGGERIRYDALVVATGARPRTIPDTPDLRGIHVLRTMEDGLGLRAALEASSRVVVVGAGFIGAEVAATARKRGLDVTVLEALPVPLSRGLGPVLGPVIAGIHADHGVDLRTGAGGAGFEGDGRVERVVLADGSTIDADVVVVGIGDVPNTDWLQGSGLELRDGVVCDRYCQAVGAPGVWAVGDVARGHNDLFDEEMRIEHWTNAVEMAMAVAANITGEPAPFAPVPYVWSDQYDSKIQIVGRPGPHDEVDVPIGAFDDRKFVALTHRDGRLTGAVGLDEPRKVMRFKRLLTTRPSYDEALAVARELG
jgi:NADPH-dependent 2,4-dienoyl-CoA reductase/sulfur reductase-like enzyme